MTIGLVTPYFPDNYTKNSGIANHYALLSEALSNLGHKVIIIHVRPVHPNEGKISTEEILSNGVKLVTLKACLPKWIINRFKNKGVVLDFLMKVSCIYLTNKRLGNIIKKNRIDIVETSSYFCLCYLYLLKNRKTPIIIRVSTTFLQMIDTYYPFQSRLFRFFGKMEIDFIRRNNLIITHAENHAIELEKLYNINREIFSIIPHGINFPKESELNHHINQPLKVLYVGRLEYRKGADILLKAIPYVLEKYDDVIFELIGHDSENLHEQNFRKINSPKVNEKVIFSGQVEDIYIKTAYSSCDIFIAPSRYESFGLIYIEAMSYNKPVIGCKVGGVPEIIQDEHNGFFSDPEDPQDLAAKILKLLNNEQMRLKMGQNARNTVREKFTKEILAVNSLKFYRKALINK